MIKFNFDCVFYYVADLEKSISFYADVLGLKLTSKDVVARFDLDGVLFELAPNADKVKLQGGNARLCLKVQDINQAVEHLAANAVRVTRIEKLENGRMASFDDPDGNEICLWQYD